MKKITLMLIMLFTANALVAQNWNPRHPGWTDSFEANGFCWCASTNYDHELDTKSLRINGTNYNIVTVCDELKKHPLYRAFSNGDAPYNDIQCGNGPANNADDEQQGSGCPGRTDLGPNGCDQIGPTFDMDWLESRSIFGGDDSSTPNPPVQQGALVHITKRNAPGFAIDGGNGGSNGQNVTLSAADPSDESQLWVEIDRGNGFYSYEKYGTNYSIDGDGGGAQRQNVYIWQTSASNQNQQWQKQATSGGAFKLIKRNATGFAINGGSGGAEGRSINMWNSASTNHNLQWFVTPIETAAESVRLEAEDFDRMSGIQTENSTESGDNVGWINDGDWLLFDDVNLSGITNMDARVASNFSGGDLEVRTGSVTGTLIGTIDINNTGGHQNWRTLNTNISNASGTQDVYLVFTGGNGFLFNVNWIEFNNSSRSNKEIDEVLESSPSVKLYPNPVNSIATIANAANSSIQIYNMVGSVVFSKEISSDNETIDISNLSVGIYYAQINGGQAIKLIKL